MANIFFQEDKVPKQAAINSATIKISEYVDCRYEVRFASDDGGTHMEVQVEVSDVGEPIHLEHPQFPIDEIFPKWGGWRVTILKVPNGYIDIITLAADSSDDY